MKKVTGFTLLELMVTVGVLGILMGVALPSFTSAIEGNRLNTLAIDHYTALMLTRSEAVKRNQQVVMCRSTDAANCITTSNWEDGFIIFADANDNNSVDTGEAIIKVSGALPTGYTLRSSSYTNGVAYQGTGRSSNGTFRLCGPDGSITSAKSIVISTTGRPRRATGVTVCL